MSFTLYDYVLSGNCYKVRLLAALLKTEYTTVAVDFHPDFCGSLHQGVCHKFRVPCLASCYYGPVVKCLVASAMSTASTTVVSSIYLNMSTVNSKISTESPFAVLKESISSMSSSEASKIRRPVPNLKKRLLGPRH